MRVITIAAAAALTAGLIGAAKAETSAAFIYNKVHTGVYSLHPNDLTPESNQQDYYHRDTASLYAGQDVGQGGCFSTGVHLPQGATIVRVMTAYLSYSSSDPHLYLYRKTFSLYSAESLVDYRIADDSGQYKTVSNEAAAGKRVVDNATYSYSYRFCLGYLDEFFGAKIVYTYTNAGD